MKIYYLGEPMNKKELEFVKEYLIDREGNTYIDIIDQIRIPTVLPTPDIDGFYRDDLRKFFNYVKRKLVKAGLEKDSGQQIVFVMAKDNF